MFAQVKHDESLNGDGVNQPLQINSQNSLAIFVGSGIAVAGTNEKGVSPAVAGTSKDNPGVRGNSTGGAGVMGVSDNVGVSGVGKNTGIYAENSGTHTKVFLATKSFAGEFLGDVLVHRNVEVQGTLKAKQKEFLIDHPLDPENKYLAHASIESSELKNMYDGMVTLDSHGEAAVMLPKWFESLNKEFRYQLTAIGAPCPGLYISTEITNNCFRLSGGKAGVRVSWMVTGVRHDAWAEANPLILEQDKPRSKQEVSSRQVQ